MAERLLGLVQRKSDANDALDEEKEEGDEEGAGGGGGAAKTGADGEEQTPTATLEYLMKLYVHSLRTTRASLLTPRD